MSGMDSTFINITFAIQQIETMYSQYAKNVGLNYLSLNILQIIYDNDGTCTQTELSDKCMASRQSINVSVREFLDKGYISMKEMKDNRRVKLISMTAKGKKYAASILEPLQKLETESLDGISKEDMETTLKTLMCYSRKLEDNLPGDSKGK